MRTMTFITGASRGLGLELARALLREGDTVVTMERKPSAALVEEAKAKGCEFIQFSVNLIDLNSGISLLQWWLSQNENSKKFDRIVLINNAGTLGQVGFIEDGTAQGAADCIRVNFEAPLLLMQAFLRETEEWAAEKRIMNISSGAGRKAVPGWSMYCSTKAALDRATETIALDESRKVNGAKLCAVAPGVVDTDMQLAIRSSDPVDFPAADRFKKLYEDNQLSSAKEVAEKLVRYLDSDAFGSEPIADIRNIHI